MSDEVKDSLATVRTNYKAFSKTNTSTLETSAAVKVDVLAVIISSVDSFNCCPLFD